MQGITFLRKGLDRIENNLDEMLHMISNNRYGDRVEFMLNYNSDAENFDYLLYINDAEEPEEFDDGNGAEKEEFIRESQTDKILLIEIKSMETDKLIQKLYQDPRERWKDVLPAAKRAGKTMKRNQVYLDEVLGFPKNVANKIAGQTYFGKPRSEISYLRKFV